jgi:transposase-like protein
LREEWFWYIFLDGTYVKYRIESERKEPVLAA